MPDEIVVQYSKRKALRFKPVGQVGLPELVCQSQDVCDVRVLGYVSVRVLAPLHYVVELSINHLTLFRNEE